MSPKPQPLFTDEDTGEIVARAQDADDGPTLWCLIRVGEDLAESRATMDRVEQRLDALETGDG